MARGSITIIIPVLLGFVLDSTYGAKKCNVTSDRTENRPDWFKLELPKDYKKRLPPMTNGCPVEVGVRFYVKDIGQINFEKMTFQADFNMLLRWIDDRITVSENTTNVVGLNDNEADKVWIPVVSFRNAVGSDGVTFDPKVHRLKLKEQMLFYVARYAIHFNCMYDLYAFPMDSQHCTIEVQNSAGDSKYIMNLDDYRHDSYKLYGTSQPLDFQVHSMNTGPCIPDGFSQYRACVQYSFVLRRYIAFHIMATYMPSVLIVILSWLSFWLGSQTTAPRVALGVTSLLTLATQYANVQRNLPPVAYVKAVDVWMFVCMFQVFGTLMEFTIVTYTIQRPQVRVVVPAEVKVNSFISSDANKNESSVDKYAKVVFPVSFILFNCIYWSYYLSL